jgi:hypothetical protein
MSDATQTTTGIEPTSTSTPSPEANGKERTPKKLYPSLAEAQAVKPDSDKQRLYQVLKDGKSLGFAWANGVNDAVVVGAKAAGFSAGVAEPKAAVTKEAVLAKLGELTDEELAAMGLSRKKGKK